MAAARITRRASSLFFDIRLEGRSFTAALFVRSMGTKLAELLSWMATWIAVMVAMLGIGAIASGGQRQDWIGVAAFFVASGSIWLIGRLLLIMGSK